ncbi:MAG TPA: hypothetical protein VMG12_34870, partial [Polyangiaceae bacterium]|nr:hypothetical protein [Polyangiaceae bacterium]
APDVIPPELIPPDAGTPDAATLETTFPERPAGLFPSCASEFDTFCIESATKDDVDILHSSYVIGASFLDSNSINWAIGAGSQYGELPVEDLGSTFHFVIRTGDLRPLYTYALADHFHLTPGGDAHSGYTVSIEATPTTIHWNFESGFTCNTVDCGDEFTQATPVASGRRLSGNTQNMGYWSDEERSRFAGTYVASNAQAVSTVLLFAPYPTPRWYVDVANPHLDVLGNPVSGSFTAWVPPNYFEAIGTTASAALATGFDVTRTEGGLAAPLAATITLDQGGTLVRIDSISYSAPRITVAQSEGGTGGTGGGSDPGESGGASGSGGAGGSEPGVSGSGGVGGSSDPVPGASGSGAGGASDPGVSGSGGAGSSEPGASGGSASGGNGSGAGNGAGGGTSSDGAAGSGNAGPSPAGAAGSSATPDGVAGTGNGTVSPSSGGKRSSSGCALGTPSNDPLAALAAAGVVALLGTRRRARATRELSPPDSSSPPRESPPRSSAPSSSAKHSP